MGYTLVCGHRHPRQEVRRNVSGVGSSGQCRWQSDEALRGEIIAASYASSELQ